MRGHILFYLFLSGLFDFLRKIRVSVYFEVFFAKFSFKLICKFTVMNYFLLYYFCQIFVLNLTLNWLFFFSLNRLKFYLNLLVWFNCVIWHQIYDTDTWFLILVVLGKWASKRNNIFVKSNFSFIDLGISQVRVHYCIFMQQVKLTRLLNFLQFLNSFFKLRQFKLHVEWDFTQVFVVLSALFNCV